ncbi:MAG: polyprenyl synthetase family protein [Oscillospiraceae bacterium]|nr:polyprenyl synthetase family protein [Oscillospiraceae bacterium]
MNFDKKMSIYRDAVEDELVKHTALLGGGAGDDVTRAIEYSLLDGGKRIRGILTLEFCEIAMQDDTSTKQALPFSAAIEMIHCYSLIHDDLPCMDDDDMRRGKPSCHIKFGQATALLAGDALLTYAFETIASSGAEPEIIANAVTELAKAAGVKGMIGGQMVDLLNENRTITQEELCQTHAMKTGALISAACRLGVMAGKGNADLLKRADDFGKNLGMAFQIVDDILDVTGNQDRLGKPTGSDADSGKSGFIEVMGMDRSRQMAEEYTQKALLSADSEFLKQLTQMLLHRNM